MKLLTLGAALSFSAAAANATIATIHASGLNTNAATQGASSGSLPLTLGIIALFAVSGLYDLAASGRIRPLPLMKTAIYAITALYLLRGLFLLPQLFGYNIFSDALTVDAGDLLLSALVLGIAVVHLAGLGSLDERNTSGGN
jgi:hypothetical protein